MDSTQTSQSDPNINDLVSKVKDLNVQTLPTAEEVKLSKPALDTTETKSGIEATSTMGS